MPHLNRRKFLQSSLALAGGTFAIGGTKSSGNILGANERIRVAVAGLHGRGKSHMAAFAKMKDVEVAYVVDPDARQFADATKRISSTAGNVPQTVQDIREALDDPNLNVVSVATPNHWHSLMTVWACQAGKDVYVEKPCSHNLHEGRIAVETARKHKRIVQHGTQSRSSGTTAQMVAAARSGKYGKLKVSYGYCYKPRNSIKFKQTEPAPNGLDFNIWLGPAPMQPFHANLVHYNWHWFWDTGNGDIGNQGVHEMDIARWAIAGAKLPKSVVSLGGRFGYKDQGQTANTQVAIFDYGETQLIFEVRGLKSPRKVGNAFVTDEGTIAMAEFTDSNGKPQRHPAFIPKGSGKAERLGAVDYTLGPGSGNFGNFIAAVRSRDQADLNADILEGHYSSALCHLANISYRLGETVTFDKALGRFRRDSVGQDSLERMQVHLERENGLKLTDVPCRAGRALKFDSRSETFVDDEAANRLLTRNYRKPFVVPGKVV